VSRTLQEPAAGFFIESHLRVMTGGDAVSANLPGYNQKLIKLQVIVAETTRDWRASGKILFDERTDDVALKALFVIDHIIRNADRLGDAAGVVNVVERAATSLDGPGHTLVSITPPVLPQLHRRADDLVSPSAQPGRD